MWEFLVAITVNSTFHYKMIILMKDFKTELNMNNWNMPTLRHL